MILAGIDVGTNSLRLLIAETSHGTFREIHSDRRITRLGQNLDHTGLLDEEARERTLLALEDFRAVIKRHGVRFTSAIGTSALRNASNSREFLDEAKRKADLTIHVITGAEEARLMLLGVAHSLKEIGKSGSNPLAASLVIDIGGGSTEIIVNRPGHEPLVDSLPLGAVYLTERFITSDPPSRSDIASLRSAVRKELDERIQAMQPVPDSIFIGTAGTITTLASIDQGLEQYDAGKINGYVLSGSTIDAIVEKLGRLSLDERKAIRGLERGREDIVFAGAVVAQEIMTRYGYRSMLVSDWGLREGIVLDLFEQIENRHCSGTGHHVQDAGDKSR